METVQAKTHAAVLAFGLAADPVPEAFQTPISTVLFDLVEQVTGGDPRVYADIQAAFDGADDVVAAAEEIAAADDRQFRTLYDRAGDRR
jgi:prephenate dehydrogenase